MTPLSLKKRKEERETIGAQRASRLQADTPSPTASRSPMDSPPRHQTPPRRAPRRIVESPDSISPQQPPAGVSSRRRFNGTTPSPSGLQSAAGDGQAGSSPSSPRRSPFFGASFQSLARSSARLFSSGSPSLSQPSALSRLSSPRHARSCRKACRSSLVEQASSHPRPRRLDSLANRRSSSRLSHRGFRRRCRLCRRSPPSTLRQLTHSAC